MDKIILKDLTFRGKHGCFPEEKVQEQTFRINLTLYTDLEEAMAKDRLEDTINYGDIFELVANQLENHSYNLIEKLAGEILRDVFNHSEKIKEVKIKVIKPNPPVQGDYKYFAVEMRRKRKWLESI